MEGCTKTSELYLPLAYHVTTFQSQNYNQIFVLQCLDQGLRHRLQTVSRVKPRNQNKIGFQELTLRKSVPEKTQAEETTAILRRHCLLPREMTRN